MAIPSGYNLGANGFYYFSDGSGPYSISTTGIVTLVGQGIGLGVDPALQAALRDRATHTGTQLSPTISDFREAVEDAVAAFLLPGANVSLTYNDVGNSLTIAVTGGGLTTEEVDDRVAALLVPGANVTLTYNDAANTLTIASTGGGGGGLTIEDVDDRVAAFLIPGANVTLTYNDAANILTVSSSSSWGVIGGVLSTQIDLQAALNAKANVLAPVTLTANTALTAALHGNRTIYSSGVGLIHTINVDAAGAWTTDDSVDIQAVDAGTFTLTGGTGTLITDSGASADSTTAVAKRVQAQRTTTANTWRTTSSVIASGGGAGTSILPFMAGPATVAPLNGTEQTVATINLSPITGNAWISGHVRFSTAATPAEGSLVKIKINGTTTLVLAIDSSISILSQPLYFTFHRETDTILRSFANFQYEQLGNSATAAYQSIAVSSLAAGCTLTVTVQRNTAADTRVTTMDRTMVSVARAA